MGLQDCPLICQILRPQILVARLSCRENVSSIKMVGICNTKLIRKISRIENINIHHSSHKKSKSNLIKHRFELKVYIFKYSKSCCHDVKVGCRFSMSQRPKDVLDEREQNVETTTLQKTRFEPRTLMQNSVVIKL